MPHLQRPKSCRICGKKAKRKMTDLVQHQPAAMADLNTQYRFAEAVTKTGGSILPKAYQGNLGNALIAINLGSSMGLAPAESLYRIDVIQGTPTASAELVASNVRKAGHKLRVRVDEKAQSVTAEIIRADDPDYTYAVTRDMAWAKQMGLAGKDNYVKQPMTMLQWRAITAVARLAASEALYGVGYTADEVREGEAPAAPRATAHDFVKPAQAEIQAAHTPPSQAQFRALYAVMQDDGVDTKDKPAIYRWLGGRVGREITSGNDLTKDEASHLIDQAQNAAAASEYEEN